MVNEIYSNETIEEIVRRINDECKDKDNIDPIITVLNEDNTNFEGKVITTGFPSLDEIIGIGGLPYSRIIEIYGKESSGKSTIALQFMKEVQDKGKIVALIDAENTFTYDYAEKLGLRKENFLLSQPLYGEQGINVALELTKTENMGMIVIDSVTTLIPKKEYEEDMEGKINPGLQAKMMSQACRKLTANLKNSDTIVVFTNQLREKIGITFGNPEITTGGKALLFYSTLRFRLSPTAQVDFPKIDGEVVGIRVRIKTIKNKVSAPSKETEIDLIFGEGFSKFRDIFTHAIYTGIINKNAHTYSFEDKKAVGKDKFLNLMKMDEILYKDILIKVEEHKNNSDIEYEDDNEDE